MRTHDSSVRAIKEISCLRPKGSEKTLLVEIKITIVFATSSAAMQLDK
jgi:hypothetical protein